MEHQLLEDDDPVEQFEEEPMARKGVPKSKSGSHLMMTTMPRKGPTQIA